MQAMCARTHTHLHTHALPTTALETVSCPTASIFPKMIFSRNCFRETLSASSARLWTWDQRNNRNRDQNKVNFYASSIYSWYSSYAGASETPQGWSVHQPQCQRPRSSQLLSGCKADEKRRKVWEKFPSTLSVIKKGSGSNFSSICS